MTPEMFRKKQQFIIVTYDDVFVYDFASKEYQITRIIFCPDSLYIYYNILSKSLFNAA